MIMLSIDCLPKIFGNYIWVMLTITLRVLIKNLVKEIFYEKRKRKINVLTVFFISYKSDVKTFFNWTFNQCLKDTR